MNSCSEGYKNHFFVNRQVIDLLAQVSRELDRAQEEALNASKFEMDDENMICNGSADGARQALERKLLTSQSWGQLHAVAWTRTNSGRRVELDLTGKPRNNGNMVVINGGEPGFYMERDRESRSGFYLETDEKPGAWSSKLKLRKVNLAARRMILQDVISRFRYIRSVMAIQAKWRNFSARTTAAERALIRERVRLGQDSGEEKQQADMNGDLSSDIDDEQAFANYEDCDEHEKASETKWNVSNIWMPNQESEESSTNSSSKDNMAKSALFVNPVAETDDDSSGRLDNFPDLTLDLQLVNDALDRNAEKAKVEELTLKQNLKLQEEVTECFGSNYRLAVFLQPLKASGHQSDEEGAFGETISCPLPILEHDIFGTPSEAAPSHFESALGPDVMIIGVEDDDDDESELACNNACRSQNQDESPGITEADHMPTRHLNPDVSSARHSNHTNTRNRNHTVKVEDLMMVSSLQSRQQGSQFTSQHDMVSSACSQPGGTMNIEKVMMVSSLLPHQQGSRFTPQHDVVADAYFEPRSNTQTEELIMVSSLLPKHHGNTCTTEHAAAAPVNVPTYSAAESGRNGKISLLGMGLLTSADESVKAASVEFLDWNAKIVDLLANRQVDELLKQEKKQSTGARTSSVSSTPICLGSRDFAQRRSQNPPGFIPSAGTLVDFGPKASRLGSESYSVPLPVAAFDNMPRTKLRNANVGFDVCNSASTCNRRSKMSGEDFARAIHTPELPSIDYLDFAETKFTIMNRASVHYQGDPQGPPSRPPTPCRYEEPLMEIVCLDEAAPVKAMLCERERTTISSAGHTPRRRSMRDMSERARESRQGPLHRLASGLMESQGRLRTAPRRASSLAPLHARSPAEGMADQDLCKISKITNSPLRTSEEQAGQERGRGSSPHHRAAVRRSSLPPSLFKRLVETPQVAANNEAKSIENQVSFNLPMEAGTLSQAGKLPLLMSAVNLEWATQKATRVPGSLNSSLTHFQRVLNSGMLSSSSSVPPASLSTRQSSMIDVSKLAPVSNSGRSTGDQIYNGSLDGSVMSSSCSQVYSQPSPTTGISSSSFVVPSHSPSKRQTNTTEVGKSAFAVYNGSSLAGNLGFHGSSVVSANSSPRHSQPLPSNSSSSNGSVLHALSPFKVHGTVIDAMKSAFASPIHSLSGNLNSKGSVSSPLPKVPPRFNKVPVNVLGSETSSQAESNRSSLEISSNISEQSLSNPLRSQRTSEELIVIGLQPSNSMLPRICK